MRRRNPSWYLIAVGMMLLASAAIVKARPSKSSVGGLVADRSRLESRMTEGDPAGRTTTRYQLRNVGTRAVRIVSVETSCGCSTPRVTPEVVSPGGAAVVEVEATPIDVGERLVHITLNTDSLQTPRVRLELVLIGGRRPPYLESLRGDLTFFGDRFTDVEREIQAITIEPPGRAKPPGIDLDASFLVVQTMDPIETPYTDGLIKRRHRYLVRFSEEPDLGDFSGLLRVSDPWNPGRSQQIQIQGRRRSPVEVYPSRIVLRSPSEVGRSAISKFAVRSTPPDPGITVEAAGPAGDRLIVARQENASEEGTTLFTVQINDSDATDAHTEYQLVVRRSDGDVGSVIPVLVVGTPQ